jgi:hypothetical protein
MPSVLAASNRPSPAMINPLRSIRIGFLNPNCLILLAICLICWLLWVRELCGFFFRLAIDKYRTTSCEVGMLEIANSVRPLFCIRLKSLPSNGSPDTEPLIKTARR